MISEYMRNKTVPRHGHTVWYHFGGLVLFFFLIQAVSGILLSLYYVPTPESAHESVERIMGEVGFGWLVRSIHHWSSHLLVFTLFVHLASKYFFQAYRKPGELTWVSGVMLLLLVLGFAFTGKLLPWDVQGYFATLVGTEIVRSTPVIGAYLADLIREGDTIAGTTLTRFFSLHAVVFPAIAFTVILLHIIRNQLTGSASPKGARTSGEIRFYPDFLYRDILSWIAGLLVLLFMVMLFPAAVGDKVDIYSIPPAGIRPEWYFLPLFQLFRMIPGTVFGINTENIIITGTFLLLVMVFSLPWIHRESSLIRTDRIYRFIGVFFIVFLIGAVLLGYRD